MSYLAIRTFQVSIEAAISEDVALPSGVSLGSVNEHLRFLVMVNDLAHGLQLFCRLFANDSEI